MAAAAGENNQGSPSGEQAAAEIEGGSEVTRAIERGIGERATDGTGGGRSRGISDDGGSAERLTAGIEGGNWGGSSSRISDSVSSSVRTSSRARGETVGGSSISSSSSGNAREESRGLHGREVKGGRVERRGGTERGGEVAAVDVEGSHGRCEAGRECLRRVAEWGGEEKEEEGAADEIGAKGGSLVEPPEGDLCSERLDTEDGSFSPGLAADARGKQTREGDALGGSIGAAISCSGAKPVGGGWLAKLKRCVDTGKAFEGVTIGDSSGEESVSKRMRCNG